MAANVAAELTLALNGLRVFAENVRFTTYWVNAIYEALGHKPGFVIRPLSDLVSDLLPEGDAVGLLERAEVRSRELCPRLPHIVSTARRSMLALHVLVDWLEIGQLFEMRACTSSDSRAD